MSEEERIQALVIFSMTDLWSLIQNKQYQTAIEETTRRFQETQHEDFLYGRTIAYLLDGKYPAALQDCLLLIEIEKAKNEPDNSYLYAGVCYWYLSQPAEAVSLWKEALDLLNTPDSANVQPALLLLYAAERLNIDSLREESFTILKMHWHNYQERLTSSYSWNKKVIDSDIIRPDVFPWPFPVVPLLLEKTNGMALQRLMDTLEPPSVRKRRQSQADFYLALDAFRKKENVSFRTHLRRCAENFYRWYEREYLLARWEIENNFPETVSSTK